MAKGINETKTQPDYENFQVAEFGDMDGYRNVERAAIEKALNEVKGNKRKAADKLGLSERTLFRKIKEYGL